MRKLPKPITLIGLHGKARSGKDTAARMLLERGVARYQHRFAQPLRDMIKAGFHIDLDDEYWERHKDDVIESFGKSPRQMLQALGTAWGREHVHPDVWVILAEDLYRSLGPGMVISDVRFPNEADWIRRMGGRIVHIRRPDIAPVSNHISEFGIALAPQDYTVDNDGSLGDLRIKLYDLFHEDQRA